MKKLFLLIAVLATFAACKKEDTVAPASTYVPPTQHKVRFQVHAASTYWMDASLIGPGFSKAMSQDTAIIMYGPSGANASLEVSTDSSSTASIYVDDVLIISRTRMGFNPVDCVIP